MREVTVTLFMHWIEAADVPMIMHNGKKNPIVKRKMLQLKSDGADHDGAQLKLKKMIESERNIWTSWG